MDFAVKFPGGYNMNSVNEISWHRRWPTKGLIPSGVVPRPEKYDGPALLVLAPDSQEPEPRALGDLGEWLGRLSSSET